MFTSYFSCLKVGKMYVVNEIQSAMRDVVDAVQNRDTEEEIPETEESGYFVSRIDQVRIIRIIASMYPCILRAVWKQYIQWFNDAIRKITLCHV